MGIIGSGILTGLGVTLRHFIETYIEDFKYMGKKAGVEPRMIRRQSPKARGMVTIEYPKEKMPVPENFRYVPFLVKDDKTGEDRCTSCGICAKVCPPQCIWIARTEDPVTKRPVPAPKDFFIDSTICMNCGYCAEFCPFDAIKMNTDYEIAYYPENEQDMRLVYDKKRLSMPESYHWNIHPSVKASELEAKAAEEAKAKAAAEAAAKKAAVAKPAAPAAPAAPAPSAAPAAPASAPAAGGASVAARAAAAAKAAAAAAAAKK